MDVILYDNKRLTATIAAGTFGRFGPQPSCVIHESEKHNLHSIIPMVGAARGDIVWPSKIQLISTADLCRSPTAGRLI
jgi:hypothetical protein